MLWCQRDQDIGLSNHKLKSAHVPDRQTDEHHGNSATILTNASRAKNMIHPDSPL